MARYLIDYTIALPYLNGVQPIVDNVNAHLSDVYLTPGVIEELYCAVHATTVIAQQLDNFVWSLLPVPLNRAVALKFAEFKDAHGNDLLECDIRLAAYAVGYGATLVTVRLTDFNRIPAVKLEDWSV